MVANHLVGDVHHAEDPMCALILRDSAGGGGRLDVLDGGVDVRCGGWCGELVDTHLFLFAWVVDEEQGSWKVHADVRVAFVQLCMLETCHLSRQTLQIR